MVPTFLSLRHRALIPLVLATLSLHANPNQLRGYVENRGQVMDQHGLPNTAVRFLLTRPGMQVQLRTNGFSFDRYTTSVLGSPQNFAGPPSLCHFPPAETGHHFHRIDVDLVGAAASPKISACGPSAEYLNYHSTGVPITGVSGVRHFQQVHYVNILPNIDLSFGLDITGSPKYDLIIRPGGDVHSIRLRYRGMTALRSINGNIVLTTEHGEVVEHMPRSYLLQEGKEVDVRYVVHTDGSVGFEAAAIPPGSTLVIDPALVWGTYLGGTDIDRAHGIAKQGADVYVTGETRSLSAMATSGAHQGSMGGNIDAFLARYNTQGDLLWCTYFGGAQVDIGHGVAAVADGACMVGTTGSANMIASSGAHQPLPGGGTDAFLARFANDGTRIWSTYFGGTADDRGLAVTSLGDEILLAGGARSVGLALGEVHQVQLGGEEDGILASFSGLGSLNWCTYYGGEGEEKLTAIATDGTAIYATGATSSTDGISTPAAWRTEYGGDPFDAMLVRFTTQGIRAWGTYVGSINHEEGTGLAMAPDGIVLCGSSLGGSNIGTAGTHLPYPDGLWDGLVMKFEPTGQRLWGTYYGGPQNDVANAVAADESGIYITGLTYNVNYIATPDGHQTTMGGGNIDAYIAKLRHDGTRVWGSYYGGLLGEEGRALAADGSGVYLAGLTGSSNNMATPDAAQPTNGGLVDAFVARFQPSPTGIGGEAPGGIAVQVWPNPTQGLLHVEFLGKVNSSLEWQLSSLHGALLREGRIPGGTDVRYLLDLSDLAPGVYLLHTALGGRSSTERVVRLAP